MKTVKKMWQSFWTGFWQLRELLAYGTFCFTTVWGLQRMSCGFAYGGTMIALSLFSAFFSYMVLAHEQHKDDVRQVVRDHPLTPIRMLKQKTTEYRRVQLYGLITTLLVVWALPVGQLILIVLQNAGYSWEFRSRVATAIAVGSIMAGILWSGFRWAKLGNRSHKQMIGVLIGEVILVMYPTLHFCPW